MFKIDKFRLVVVALLAVFTVAVAACESEPEKVPDPLIVGHLNALTGSLSYFGESHSDSIGLAADHINRAGGIQGGSVVLVHRDTAVNPVQGVSAAEELVNVQGVVAIVGALASGCNYTCRHFGDRPQRRAASFRRIDRARHNRAGR